MILRNTHCDYHVHIGQYCQAYYYATRVFSALKASGINEVWFSSTTRCMSGQEGIHAHAASLVDRMAPFALALYMGVRSEVRDALSAAAELGMRAHALYWIVPDIHFAQAAGITVERAMAEIPYTGFKIHPRAQRWDLQDARTAALAEEIFNYAERHGRRILIHCGEGPCESPRLFEPFIKGHSRVIVQLAHCRPVAEILAMLQGYRNTICDTAFASDAAVTQIAAAGFGSRVVYGSDFPITHWYSVRPVYDPTEAELVEFCMRCVSE